MLPFRQTCAAKHVLALAAAMGVLSALSACSSVRLFLGPSPSTLFEGQPGLGLTASASLGRPAVLPMPRRNSPGAGVATLGAAAVLLLAATRSRSGKASTGGVSCKAVPMNHKIPVVDLEGNQVGEEDMQFRTFSKETANYVVHQAFVVWQYQQQKFSEFHPRRGDVKRGRKLWRQKGTGKARMGSTYSPLFGKSATNKNRHGLDDRRRKRIPRQTHTIAISTVLQSKWKGIKIVDGLEDIEEPRYYDLMDIIKNTTGVKPEKRSTLMIARNCYGKEHPIRCVPTYKSYRSPLYMAGRLIDKFEMRRPRDIDAQADGLYQCLKARNLIISREAFYDLKAKFDASDGWSFMDTDAILVQQLQKLVKEYPYDRAAEFDSARKVPAKLAEREFWAKEVREKQAEEASQ